MDVDSKNLKIVQTIIMLAHNLDMDVIAEGIETEEQQAKLKNLECAYGQGYFFSLPLAAKAAEVLIAKLYASSSAYADCEASDYKSAHIEVDIPQKPHRRFLIC